MREPHRSISAPEEEEETTEVEDDDDDEDDDDEPDVPQKTEEQTFTENLMAEVAAGVKEGDNKTINATRFHSFSAKTLGTLLSNKGVDFTLYFDYEGECFKITIPAGAVLEEGCEWYGPLKLNAMFGRTMIDRSELEAAIKK